MNVDQKVLLQMAKKSGVNIIVAENVQIGAGNNLGDQELVQGQLNLSLTEKMLNFLAEVPSHNKLEAVRNLALAAVKDHYPDLSSAASYLGCDEADLEQIPFVPYQTCECGCGQKVSGGLRYVRGHQNRMHKTRKRKQITEGNET